MREDSPTAFVLHAGLAGGPGTVSLMSPSASAAYFRHRNYVFYTERCSGRSEEDLFRRDASFRLQPCPWHDGSFILEAVTVPGYYVRHQAGRLKLTRNEKDDAFFNESAFRVLCLRKFSV